ncbi:MAG: signal peptidase II [Candidatus Omnitrophica bacterium]|nr:signal peptidase II [Candidatus Omnitrophota bacterium]
MPGKKGKKITFIVLFVLALDRLTKILVSSILSLNQSAAVIKGIFHITLVHNKGAAFGILKNQLLLLITTSLIAIFLIFKDFKKNKRDRTYNISLSLILGGALGNLIDRVVFGYVIDFLDFRVWPVFNVADSAITIGVIMMGYSILFSRNKSMC